MSAVERFTRARPCPVCGGHDALPRDKGMRCWGFLDSTGDYARCTREDHAGGLPVNDDETYSHRLRGACRCGIEHGHADDHQDRAPETRHEIKDTDGNVRGVHVRRRNPDGTKGRMWWERPGGVVGLNGLKVADMLYRAETLRDAPADAVVFLTEGEPAADALAKLGLLAVGTVTGAGSANAPKAISQTAARMLADRRVVLWPDADADGGGLAHMRACSTALAEAGAHPVFISWPDAPDHGDAVDFVRGRTRDEVLADIAALVRAATPGVDSSTNGAAGSNGASGTVADQGAVETTTEDGASLLADDFATVRPPQEGALARTAHVEPRLTCGDLLIADRFVAEHGEDLMFVPGIGWYAWQGGVWRPCAGDEHVERAKLTARRLIADPDVDRRTSRSAMQEPRVRGALRFARSDPAVLTHARDLDTDGYLLGTPGGTCDLRTGLVRAPVRSERISLQTSVAPADAAGPAWQRFLQRVQPDPQMRQFIQVLIGMALVAAANLRLLPIFLGTGANGKSQFIIALSRVLGDYAYAAQLSLLMLDPRRVGGATPELAALRGRRFVTVSESPEDGRLSVERVKLITGGDDITARFLHANPETFRPTHTAILSTNHAPRVADAGPAIWDRLILVRWDVIIPPSERVPDLGEKLAAAEGPGILRWAIDGAVTYLHDGLVVPQNVEHATQTYRRAEDIFGAFLDECTTEHPASSVAAGALLARYRQWSQPRPAAPQLSDATLAERLAAKGYENTRRNRRSFWIGLRLRDDGNG